MASRPKLNSLEVALRRVTVDLDDLGRRWAVVGGLAVSARSEPRMTRDIDVAVVVDDDADAEALVRDLQRRGYETKSVIEQDRTHRLATVRLVTEAPAIVVDLLFASSGIEAEVAAAAEVMEILPDLRVPVAQTGHLLALKVLARDDRHRPQDWDDLIALLREASTTDLTLARTGLRLVAERGYSRGKDVVADFEALLGENRPR